MKGNLKVGSGYLGIFAPIALLLLRAFGLPIPPGAEECLILLTGGSAVAGAKVLRDAQPKR